jgi:RNA polymerase sigma-70 factor (ECF subfamily)
VRQLQAGSSRRDALESLLRCYRQPLKAHLEVRRKLSSDAADDVLQGFIESKVLRLRLIEQADRAKGRFRSFLLTALDRYLIDQFRKAKTAEPVQSLGESASDLPAEPEDDSTPFNVAWARQAIDEAMRRMQRQCESSGRPDVWGVFEERVARPILEQAQPASYEALVARFGFTSPAQASNVLMTAKRMFRRAIEQVVGEYTEPGQAVGEEIDALRKILQGE